MNVLIIGSGGREHALAHRVKNSFSTNKLYILPGNPGTANLGENIEIESSNYKDIIKFCRNNKVDLVVVGPEQPLMEGITDELINSGIKVFGPTKSAAMIEGDKSFAKDLMVENGIPTANYKIFENSNYEEALTYLDTITYPTVIKASGLAAGKGVAICNSKDEAQKTLKLYFEDKVFGKAGEKVVIEEFLTGEEASVFAITDGEKYFILPVSQDHKAAYDGDKGPNTGGMGAYAPAPLVDGPMLNKIKSEIILPTLTALRESGRKFVGCLYAGLMITENGPKVIEFNCRFGDPETQVVLPLIDGDFAQLLYSAANGNLVEDFVKINENKSVCVVAASGGYPGKYEKGKEIFGLDNDFGDEIIIYHAGTKEENSRILTNGGRVLGITSVVRTDSLKDCKIKAYEALSKIKFEGIYFRNDISDKALTE